MSRVRVQVALCILYVSACDSTHAPPASDAGNGRHESDAGHPVLTGGAAQTDAGISVTHGVDAGSSDPSPMTDPTDAAVPDAAGDTQDDAGEAPGHPGSGGAGAGGGAGAENAAGAGAGGTGGEPAAGSGGAPGAGQGGSSGSPTRRRFCLPPPTCVPVDTLPFAFDVCCPEHEDCGYQIARPTELADGTCKPVSEIFLKQPGQPEQRVVTEGQPDQLITPDCETRTLLAFSLPGCCMPNNRCGVSTYAVADILLGLVLFPAPFTFVECVSTQQLNQQFRATSLAAFGQIPEATGTCDYADLDARLKPPEQP